MKVLLLSRYGPLGASSRVRSYQYLPYLKAHGLDVTVSPLLGDDYLRKFYSGRVNHLTARIGPYFQRIIELFKARKFDLLWIEYELFPWMPAWMEIIMSYINIPYIVDYDDAMFHRYNLNSNRTLRALLGNKTDKIMRNANVVVAGNMYLKNYAVRSGAKRVESIPTVIDLGRYSIKDRSNGSRFNVGWIGSPVTAKYLNIIKPAMIRFFKEGNSSLSLVGSGHLELDEVPINIIPWSEETEVANIQDFDVGIMPLPGSPWERGKCGYKLIQYMACGKPVIASPVGANTEIVEHGVNGFLVGSTEEWLEALTVLRDDIDLRKKMGAAGRQMVEEKYCLQVTAPELLSIFQSVKEISN